MPARRCTPALKRRTKMRITDVRPTAHTTTTAEPTPVPAEQSKTQPPQRPGGIPDNVLDGFQKASAALQRSAPPAPIVDVHRAAVTDRAALLSPAATQASVAINTLKAKPSGAGGETAQVSNYAVSA